MNNRLAVRRFDLCLPIPFLSLALAVLSISAVAQTTTQITIPSNPLWTDTMLALAAGETVTISATGSWNWGQAPQNFGPDGDPVTFTDFWDDFRFFDIVDHGRLIGFVGPDPFQGHFGEAVFFPQTSTYISVGSGQTFVAPYSGELWLGFNDDAVSKLVGDNIGSVLANITFGGSDITGPVIQTTTPSTVYTQNQKVHAKYSCTDPDDPVVSCAGPVANGAPVDTSSSGPHAFTVIAADSHGNASTKTVVYLVANAGLSPQYLAFSPQYVGSHSPTQRVTLYNRLSTSLNISAISASGNFPDTTTCTGTLAAHKSCVIDVSFEPTTTGDIQGSLSVSDSAGTQSIELIGFGTLVNLTPGKVAFRSQKVGTTSSAKDVTLENAQTRKLKISSINVNGDFALAPSTTCPARGNVSVNSSCTIAITFTPTMAGTRAGTLILQTSYPTAPVVVKLSGTGTP